MVQELQLINSTLTLKIREKLQVLLDPAYVELISPMRETFPWKGFPAKCFTTVWTKTEPVISRRRQVGSNLIG